MKTQRDIEYRSTPYGHIATIPAGTTVTPATNLPQGGWWAAEWPRMTATASSWMRNYGFHLTDEEVGVEPSLPKIGSTVRVKAVPTVSYYCHGAVGKVVEHKRSYSAGPMPLPNPVAVIEFHAADRPCRGGAGDRPLKSLALLADQIVCSTARQAMP